MKTTASAERKTVFDIGMYDGSDTAYYLDEGYRVVAVEAHPALVARARERFQREITTGRLHLVNAAIGDGCGTTTLVLASDLGASSTVQGKITYPIGSVTISSISLRELIIQYGEPYYLKVDIEGADRLCILAIEHPCPSFLSFEVGDDIDELVAHIASRGYTRFRIVNQCTFLDLRHEHRIYDRAAMRLMRLMGYAEPRLMRRNGRFFVAGHSSGPAPWRSDVWYSSPEVLSQWRTGKTRTTGWYDMHAAHAKTVSAACP